MPKLDYLEKRYQNIKSPFLDKLKEYHKKGGFKDDLISNRKNERQISLEEYTKLKYDYLKLYHQRLKRKFKGEYDEDINPISSIKRKIYLIRSEKESNSFNKQRDKNIKFNFFRKIFIPLKDIDVKYGFLIYPRNKHFTPFWFIPLVLLTAFVSLGPLFWLAFALSDVLLGYSNIVSVMFFFIFEIIILYFFIIQKL